MGKSNLSSPSDAELAARIRDGDSAAFKTLYFRYFEKLYQFTWYRIRASEQARDLTQEVFARLWRNREGLDPEKSVKAYLYRIAHNLIINHLQRQTIERNYLSTLSEDSFIMHPSGDRNLCKSIARAIKDLPEKFRIVFMLHRFEEFTYADIAESLGISIKTVEKRMSIALKILREKLAHWLHHD